MRVKAGSRRYQRAVVAMLEREVQFKGLNPLRPDPDFAYDVSDLLSAQVRWLLGKVRSS